MLVTVGAVIAVIMAMLAWNSVTTVRQSKSLRDTMLNAVDHYASIDARYDHRLLATPDSPEQLLTVDIVREPGVGAVATLTRFDGRVIEFVTNGRQTVERDVKLDEYTVWGVAPPAMPERRLFFWDKLLIRVRKGKDAANLVILRREVTELPLGWVSTALWPQEWVLGTYDSSRVTRVGEEMLLGRLTTRLEVVASNGRSFTVNADRETGVLLRMEILAEGKVQEVLQATRFKVNEPVDRTRFTLPDLTGKKVRNPG